MVAWMLINVMRTANINAMHETDDRYAKQVTPKPRTKKVKDWVMVSIREGSWSPMVCVQECQQCTIIEQRASSRPQFAVMPAVYAVNTIDAA